MAGFFERIKEQCEKKNSLLCVGLDPRITLSAGESCLEKIVSANSRVIEQTWEYAVCYKPNIAFYECYGAEGLVALKRTLELIPDDLPVILDSKRSDIGATAEAYAQGVFEYFKADGVTLNPYLGRDSFLPFLKYKDKGVFALSKTSNPQAGQFQDLRVLSGLGEAEELFLAVARECISWNRQVGLVVAGNDPESLLKVRAVAPDSWILAPGIGAQGGDIREAISAGQRADGLGILVAVSRTIAQAENPAKAARQYRDSMNLARTERKTAGTGKKGFAQLNSARKKEILKGLIDFECFKVGEFVLKSGIVSPFYVDLRRIISDTAFLRKVARAYAELLSGLKADRIAAIPLAALPLATAVSLETAIPLIYPRISVKDHGTRNRVEGSFNPGERVVLLDDLITSGKSKLEAITVLRAADLVVEDLLVLLERGAQGRQDMLNAGVTLHAYAHMDELLEHALEVQLIDRDQEKAMKLFIRGS